MSAATRLLAAGHLMCLLSARARADDLAAEASRREDALNRDGFNLTQRLSLPARPQRSSERLEFVIPSAGEEHRFSVWAASPDGELSLRLLAPGGQVRASVSARQGEVSTTFDAPAGTYAIEIERPAGVSLRGQLGIKGPVLRLCPAGAQPVVERPPIPAQGFHWPYLLYAPAAVRSRRLLVAPNNTGFASADVELLRTSASCELRRHSALADRLGAPLLIPLFPRPRSTPGADNLYLHALTRPALAAQAPALRRVDLQLLAMVDDARAALRARGVAVDAQVLLVGFSAAGSFVNRFAMLHPERVAAVASGSPGGWPLAPLAALDGERLPYPVGIADVAELTGRPIDRRALARVRWFFYLGAEDRNDAVPHRDSFSAADEALIARRFGATPVARWPHAEQCYQRAALNARFALYPGVAHAESPAMQQDIAAFLASATGP